MNVQAKYNLTTKPFCVLADGPQETDGDGGYEFVVCFGDEDGEPITDNKAAVWKLDSAEETDRFAAKLAQTYNLELVNETTPV